MYTDPCWGIIAKFEKKCTVIQSNMQFYIIDINILDMSLNDAIILQLFVNNLTINKNNLMMKRLFVNFQLS